METALAKKIGFKVVRKLKIVRAFVPQRRISDEIFTNEIGAERIAAALHSFPNLLHGLTDSKSLKAIAHDFSEDLERANVSTRNALRHRFDLLGSGLVDLGQRIDWCTDFKSGKSWEKKDFRLQRLVNLRDNSDVKIPWELSRCNHFLPMAIAYLDSGDESFRVEFENQVLSWSEQNEYLQTVNWSCPMDTAIRCINWLLAMKVFSTKKKFNDDFVRTLMIELYKGGKSIFENLEKTGDGNNTNHYLSDLLGLLYLGQLFKDCSRLNNWRKFAISELEREILTQIDDDGLDYESSLPYHGLVTEIFLLAYQLSKAVGFEFSDSYQSRLRKMVTQLARFTGNDGLVENFGDNDDGRILKLFCRQSRDYRDVIDLGHSLLAPPEFLPARTPEKIAFFGQTKSAPAKENVTGFGSILFENSGICQMRSQEMTVNFFANPIGTAGLGNHKHNDLLSFTLRYKGIPIFVDPGTFVYTADEQLRNEFRSTLNHNTVTIDDFEQNRMVGGLLFLLRTDGTPKILEWQSNERFDLIVAEHNGYERLDEPAKHRRSLYFDKRNQFVLIRDEIEGAGSHKADFNFNLDKVTIETLDKGCLKLNMADGAGCLIFGVLDSDTGFRVGNSWISPSYGVKYPGIRISHSTNSALPVTRIFGIASTGVLDSDQFRQHAGEIRKSLGW